MILSAVILKVIFIIGVFTAVSYFIQCSYTANYLNLVPAQDLVDTAYRNDSNSSTSFKRIQDERTAWIAKRCASGVGTFKLHTQYLDQFMVDRKHKVLFCSIPKVGCTTLKNIFLSTYKDMSQLASVGAAIHIYFGPTGIPTFKEINETERNIILKTYKKYLFVRDPLERFVSAYRDKLEVPGNYLFEGDAKNMICLFRNSSGEEGNLTLHPVTFTEFTQYVVSGHNRQPHWAPYDLSCSPCLVKYDYIGKLETFTEDMTYILAEAYHMNSTTAQKFLADEHENQRGKTNSSMENSYLRQLSMDTFKKLKEVYAFDIDLFQYNY